MPESLIQLIRNFMDERNIARHMNDWLRGSARGTGPPEPRPVELDAEDEIQAEVIDMNDALRTQRERRRRALHARFIEDNEGDAA
jgi:hypothetical protein